MASLAKNVIFNLCKAFPNASPPPILRSSTNISRLSFTTSVYKHQWDGHGVDANRDPRPELAYEDGKEKAKDYAEEGTNRVVVETARAAKEKAKAGTSRVAVGTPKRSVEGAWEAAKGTTQKMKETVMGANGDQDVNTKAGTKFDN